jgi:NADPH-dependent 2,4-dienoyl-CoA reductase/sulfur reductase-like enzyme
VEADLVLLALGVRPNSGLAQEMGLEVGVAGAIRVDERMRASLEGVYAAGDVTEVLHLVSGQPAYIPLGDTANKQGRVAGTNLAGGDAVFRGVVGTAVSKVFDLGVARTGLKLAEAKALGLTAEAVMVRANDHAEYYPDRHSITVRLVYQPEGGRLLGAQIAARGDAVKRIDVVAALLHQGASVADLAALDLAYAPPYSPVWDPLLVAANQVVG